MLSTIYNYSTSGYQEKLAHLPSHKSGVYEVKSKHNFMMTLFYLCISNLTHLCGPYIIRNLEMWVPVNVEQHLQLLY
jgi:hypothetical protein